LFCLTQRDDLCSEFCGRLAHIHQVEESALPRLAEQSQECVAIQEIDLLPIGCQPALTEWVLNRKLTLDILYNFPQSLETYSMLSQLLDCLDGYDISEGPPCVLPTPLWFSDAWGDKPALHPVK
jgi:hypothetical protein